MRSMRLLAIPLFLALPLLLPAAPRVFAQSCGNVSSVFSPSFYYLPLNGLYTPGGAAWWRAGDYYGYEITPNLTSNVVLHIYDDLDVYGGVIYTWTTNVPYTIGVHTAGIAVVSDTAFSADVCTPAPTPTPVPPTNTPTNTSTPTEVIVTVTPSPTLTPNPSSVLQERMDQTFSLQVFGFTVMLGIGIYFFLRLR